MKQSLSLIAVLSFLSLSILSSACNRDKSARESRKEARPEVELNESQLPETLIPGGYDHEEMDAAIARAQSEVDNFIAVLDKRQGSDFSVKVPITDQGETEHFWIVDVTYLNGVFEGKIGNEPGVVTNVRYQQKWRATKAEVSDWSFMRDGKMHGNYTMRPLLKTLPKDEADRYRSILAKP
jgi:uncharacterized protein YegJ (DUF2314 family)